VKELDELAALARQVETAPPPEDEYIAPNFPVLVANLTDAGEIDAAAKITNFARRIGRHIETTPEVTARAKRLRAENGAEMFRAINRANATNHRLPAWIRGELGVSH
jgi:hypothetical protein